VVFANLMIDFLRLRHNTALPAEKIKRLQAKKLRALLHYAYERSPYYHRVFKMAGITEANLDSVPLCQFPPLDKETLMQQFDELVTVPDVKQAALAKFDAKHELSDKLYQGKYHLVHSSGSTGEPHYFVYDEAAWNSMLLGILRGALWGLSLPEIVRLLLGKPRILYIAATGGRYGGAMAVGDGIAGIGAEQMQLDVNTPLENWRDKVEKFNSNIIIGYPSAIKILAQLYDCGALRLHIERVITCGEPLAKHLRAYLEDTLNVPVLNFYGASETLAIGVEADPKEGMFLFDDLNYIEVNNGQMYVTCLYNYTQPLIRYKLGDTLRLREGAAANGCAFNRADTVDGRDEDILWLCDKNGKLDFLHPLSVEGICAPGLIDYQLRQTELDTFVLWVQANAHADKEAIRRQIAQVITDILSQKRLDGIKFSIEFVPQLLPDARTGKKALIVALPQWEVA